MYVTRIGTLVWLLVGCIAVLNPPTALAADCNDNGVDDMVDIAAATSADCNGNSIPDRCDVGSSLFSWSLERALRQSPAAGDDFVAVAASGNHFLALVRYRIAIRIGTGPSRDVAHVGTPIEIAVRMRRAPQCQTVVVPQRHGHKVVARRDIEFDSWNT